MLASARIFFWSTVAIAVLYLATNNPANGETIGVQFDSIEFLDRDGGSVRLIDEDFLFVCTINEFEGFAEGHCDGNLQHGVMMTADWVSGSPDDFALDVTLHLPEVGNASDIVELGRYGFDGDGGIFQIETGDTLHGSSGGSLAVITGGVNVQAIELQTVPEPASGVMLLASALAALGWRVRR